jgi:hypothetical protein
MRSSLGFLFLQGCIVIASLLGYGIFTSRPDLLLDLGSVAIALFVLGKKITMRRGTRSESLRRPTVPAPYRRDEMTVYLPI